MNWQNCIITTTAASLNVRVSQAGATFTYLGGTYTKSNTRFLVSSSNSNWKDFRIISPLSASSPLIAVTNINKFENLYVR